MSRHVVNQIISSQVVVDPPFLLDLTDPVTGAYLPLPAVACSVVKLSIHATKCMDVYNASTLETKTFGFIQHPQFGWVLDYPGIQAFCVTTTGAPAVGRVKKWYNQVYEVPRSSGFGTLDPDTQQKHLLGGGPGDVFPTYPYICNVPPEPQIGVRFKNNQPIIYSGGPVPATGVGGRMSMLANQGGDLFNGKNYHHLQMVNVYGGQGEKYNWTYLFKVRHGVSDIPISIQGADTNSIPYKPLTNFYSYGASGAPVFNSSSYGGTQGSTNSILTSIDAEWNINTFRNIRVTVDHLTAGSQIYDTQAITNGVGATLPTHAQGTLLDLQMSSTHPAEWQHLVIYDEYSIKPYLPLLRDTIKMWFK